jgi:hypothetical protein
VDTSNAHEVRTTPLSVQSVLTGISLPYIIRFRQCLIENRSPTNTSKRPLLNALKYASSFPVIFLSAAQRIVVQELAEVKGELVTREPWHGEHPLFRLW